jgi:hypothetical protein
VTTTVGRTDQPKVLLVGDSVGCFIGAALDERQVADGVVTLNRSRIGCPLVEAEHERYAEGHTDAPVSPACIDGMASTIAKFEPDVSVLLVGGPMVREYDIGNGSFVGPCDAEFAPWYRAGARRSIEALSAKGARVVVVSTVHPPDFIDIGPGIDVPAEYGRDVDCTNRLLREAVDAEPGTRFVDLDAYICPRGDCRTKVDGVTLRADGRHFQQEAANLVARWLLPQVLDGVSTR